jgi:hypothetical protein
MSGGFNNPLVSKGGSLVYPSIHSPGFITGVTGWSIDKNGNAEFNNGIFRGFVEGTHFIINSDGAFFYSGAPAANNLFASIADSNGTDTFGNIYLSGWANYELLSGVWYAVTQDTGQIAWWSGGTNNQTTVLWVQTSQISGAGSPDLTLNSNRFIKLMTGLRPLDPVTPTQAEDWHAFGALQNTWAKITGDTEPSFRILASPPNSVEIAGVATATVGGGNNGNATVIAGPMPAPYRPNNRQPVFITVRGSTAAPANAAGFAVTTGGNLVIETLGGAAGDVLVVRWHGIIDLDIPNH